MNQHTAGTKTCPACAEEIKPQAVVCRYCGYDFSTGMPGPRGEAKRGTSGFAIASMVLGIVWIWWIGSILALVFGYVARREIANSGGALEGKGMATAGIVLGWIGVATLILFVLVFMTPVVETSGARGWIKSVP